VFKVIGAQRPDLTKKILDELSRRPKGVWLRKLARTIDEPVATVHRYVTVHREGYAGSHVVMSKPAPKERGGHIFVRLRQA
jgi:hypothetical protein